MKETGHLQGKVALITGGSRGIGRHIVVALANEGVNIAFTYKKSKGEAEKLAAEIEQHGTRCIAIAADVSISSDIKRMITTANDELGTIDILVNNAGISRPQQIQDISESDWDELVDTNLKSAFLATQGVLPGMRARKWGRIINISSVAAQLGGVIGPHYAASKAGMIGLTHSYANILAKEGITVNAIAPALIATDMMATNKNARADLIPIGRFGTAEEVADVVVMIVRNSYITGQTINVNGGWYMS